MSPQVESSLSLQLVIKTVHLSCHMMAQPSCEDGANLTVGLSKGDFEDELIEDLPAFSLEQCYSRWEFGEIGFLE